MAPIAQTQSQSPPIAEKSLKQLYEWHRDEFYNWLKVKGVSAKTIKGYISALDRHIPDVDSPKALKQYLATTEGLPMDKLTKGLKNLFNYLKEIDEEHEATWAKWHGAVKVPQSGVREVYISNDELLEAYEHIKYEGNEVALTVFKALVFSGMRLSHLLELLQEWDGAKVVKVQEGKVCRYPATHVSKGQKKAFWLYFPCALDVSLSASHTKRLAIMLYKRQYPIRESQPTA